MFTTIVLENATLFQIKHFVADKNRLPFKFIESISRAIWLNCSSIFSKIIQVLYGKATVRHEKRIRIERILMGARVSPEKI